MINSPYKYIVCYDTETMGLNPEKHDMTEIAMVAINVETLEIDGQYEAIIKRYSDSEFTQEAKDITGLDEDILEAKGKDADVVIEEVLDFFDDHKVESNKPLLGGHNIDEFDNKVLERFIGRSRRKLSRFVNLSKTFDTKKECRLAFLDSPNYQLGTCCSRADIVLKDAHRAMNDVIANAKLIIELLRRMRGEGGSGEVVQGKSRINFDLY